MTRMWCVDPQVLCRNHLLGEHKELHQIVGIMNSHPHGDAIVEGHAEKDQVDTSLIEKRHMELVDEMVSRGINHNSELPTFEDPVLGSVDPESNITDLMNRCEDCAEKIRNSMVHSNA